MASNEQLESFLASESAPAPEPAPSAAPEASPAAPAPKPEDDGEPPVALDGEPVIPRRAYEDERRKRQDWKERAARFEGELAALKRQLEEAQRQPRQPVPQPQPPQPQPPIDIVANPQGFVERVQQVFVAERTQLAQQMLNDRLNHSEERLRDKIGDKVDEYVADFQQFAQADPSLWGKLYAQANPYGWLQKEIDRQRLHRDVGNDPEAFKAKLRAEWEQEQQQRQTAPQVSPAAGLQPSLATARSVAGRTSSTWSGEPSLEDVLAPIQNRKSQNGQTKRF